MRRVVVTLGLAIAAFGLLFLLQGLGVVRWPNSSFMVGRQVWVTRGTAIAVIGLLIVLAGRRLSR